MWTRLAFLLSLLLAPLAHATTYYVATTGADANPGTQGQPFRTLQRAAGAVRPGDTVQVAPGTYTQPVVTRTSGVAGAPIRFVSTTKWGAKIVSGGAGIWTNHGNHVEIMDFDISGSGLYGIANYASHVLIQGNNVHGLAQVPCQPHHGGSGILAGIRNVPATDINIIGNVVHDTGGGAAARCPNPRGPHGIYHVHSGVIANNVVTNNRGVGIHVWHEPHDLLITRNHVIRNGHGGIVVGGAEGPAHGITVSENIVMDNYGKGLFQTGKNRPGNRYLNNVVARNARGNVDVTGATEDGTRGDGGPLPPVGPQPGPGPDDPLPRPPLGPGPGPTAPPNPPGAPPRGSA